MDYWNLMDILKWEQVTKLSLKIKKGFAILWKLCQFIMTENNMYDSSFPLYTLMVFDSR